MRERFDKVNGSQIFALHREIGCYTQGNSSISTYYSRLRQLWDEYASLVTLPICSCESSRKFIEFDQQHKLFRYFIGLHESFVHIRSHILMMDPLPTVSNAFAIISKEESHRSLLNVSPQQHESSALFSAQNRRNNDVICEHCNLLGHNKENCFRLIGYPPGHKFYKGPWKGWSHGIFILDIEWIIDSSDNDHMIGYHGIPHVRNSYADATDSIQLPNGSSTKFSSLGTIPINQTSSLSNALIVPEFRHNLLSISKFTIDHQCFVTFFPRFCVFQGLSNGKIMGIGRERQGLYYLDNSSWKFLDSQPNLTLTDSRLPLYRSLLSAVNGAQTTAVSQETLWHQRLGHISLTRMRMLPFLQAS
ncbi:uncharacterized protein LOC142556890 [Primulina tabacum]|uniref:uncharacterized protein LOC142556890 n=1 Tax=Primulina tabacum TaxID=48773 RepID=UPI003F592CF5